MSIDKKWKKGIVMMLTLLLLMSSVPSYGAATRFKDVPKGHWTYSHVEKMAKLGYLDGYPDGTFGPSGKLTFMQSMSTLSRFTNPTAAEKINAINAYNSLLNEVNVKQTWEREGLAIALYKGIVSENEVRNANKMGLLNKPIERIAVSVFLVKAMGLEDMANSISVVYVPFKDVLKINSGQRKYLEVLLDAKVLDPNGKGEGIFDPKSVLSRGEMATLLSRSYDYLQKNPVTVIPEKPKPIVPEKPKPVVPEKPKSVGTEVVKAKIKRITNEIGRKFLVIDDRFGGEVGYIVENTTSITIDGRKSNASSLSKGQEVELKVKKDTKELISVDAISVEKDVEVNGVRRDIKGYVIGINNVYNKNTMVTVKNKDNDKKEIYELTRHAHIRIDNEVASSLPTNPGYYVEITLEGNKIIDIYVDTSSMETSIIGDVSHIDWKNRILEVTIDNINFEDEDYSRIINVYVGKNANITYKGSTRTYTFDDLYRGDRINIVGTYEGVNFVADTVQIR